jgi:hypothetical protein
MRRFLTYAVILSVCSQINCDRPREQGAEITQSVNQNKVKDGQADKDQTNQLQLELRSARNQIGFGDCTDLQLDVTNHTAHPARWPHDWTIEHEGPGSLPAEAWPRSDIDIDPGKTITVFQSRLCQEHLVPGEYRLRVKADSVGSTPIRSNWITLQVTSMS